MTTTDGLRRGPAGRRGWIARRRRERRAAQIPVNQPLAESALHARTGIKRLLPRTLFGRALMIIITPVLLMQATAAYYFYDRHWDTMTSRLSEGVAGEIAFVIEEYGKLADPAAVDALFEQALRQLDLVVSVSPGPGDLIQQPSDAGGILRGRLTEALRDQVGRPFRIDPEVAGEWSIVTVDLGPEVMQVLVPRRRLFSSTSQVFIAWMVGSGVVLFAVALIFMRNQIRPIRRLAIAADGFGKGRDMPQFKPEGATEVRQAARAFLVMRERVQRAIDQRTEMLAGVSHDLRTPLTRMRLQLAMLGDGPEIGGLVEDVADMEEMIEAYLAFARGEGEESPQGTDIAALLDDVVAAARREGAAVGLTAAPSATVPLRPKAFRRCLANLLSNARRYARRVEVAARLGDHMLEIVIDDDGPGIPESEREAVFKPFYRRDQSRNTDSGGSGLGLTIARDIALSHGGEIDLADSPLGGLRAQVRVPV